MPSQLESALVLRLRNPIKWAAALEAPSSGTLTPVDADKPFDPRDYLQRDRELMFRDVVVGAAILDTSIQISNVWEHDADRPFLQSPVLSRLPLDRAAVSSTGTNLSMVRHVHNASIPLDAVQFADSDLYGRDALIYEVIARACQQSFAHPPVLSMDSTGTLVSLNGSSAWSLAEGQPEQTDVNSALPLRRDAFKDADRFLADRDNQLAAYAAQLAQVLKNPFAYALRLYVRVDGPSATGTYEPETYALVSDSDTQRVWQAEPGLNDRFRIRYDKQHQTLQWSREQSDELHVPQLYAMTVPAIEPGQVLTTIPEVPDPQDCQYWRHKAGQVIPEGISLHDTASFLDWTAGSSAAGGASGGITQPDGASLTVPGVIDFHVPGMVSGKLVNPAFAQYYRVSVLAQPNSRVEMTGGQNISVTNGTDGGATWEVDASSIGPRDYLVEGGDGVVYDGQVIWPGDTVKGKAGVTSFTQYNPAFPSQVRQQTCNWSLTLPPGPWTLQLEYTNVSGTAADGFGVAVSYSAGANLVSVIPDTTPLPFDVRETNGVLKLTAPSFFDVLSADPATVQVSWNYGEGGQFHVRRLIFDSTHISTGSYAVDCILANGSASANVTGVNKLSEVMLWEIPVTGNSSADVRLSWTDAPSCPVRLKQVQIQQVGSYAPTPNSFDFGGWRLECLDRAERVIQQGYAATITAYGTNLAAVCPDNVIVEGQLWTRETHGLWMGMVECRNPRLRDVPDMAGAGIRVGRQYEVTSGFVAYGSGLYDIGDRFYGTVEDGTSYSGGVVKQIGALMRARPGHIGKPCLMPRGIYLDSDGTAHAAYPAAYATPVFVALQGWMIELGAYVAQEEFWLPDFYDRFDETAKNVAERVLIQTGVSPSGSGTAWGGGLLRLNSMVTVFTAPNTGDPHNLWAFSNWTDSTGLVVSTDTAYSFFVVEPQTLIANYVTTPTLYTISANIDPFNGGAVSGVGVYSYGDIVSLFAYPSGSFAAAVGADVVLVMDESGSMGGEHGWIKSTGLAGALDAALKAAGIGSGSVPNRFGLTGFGGPPPGHQAGHKHTIAGLEFLTTTGSWQAAWDAAVDTLKIAGGIEDGYSGMTLALTNYGWRGSNVGKIIILCTDEPRNTPASATVAYDPALLATIKGSLTSGKFICADCVSLKIYDDAHPTTASDPPVYHTTVHMGPVMGFGWDGFTKNGISYVKSGSSFVTGVNGRSGGLSAPGPVPGDTAPMYVNTYEVMTIDPLVKGSEWDLSYLRTLQAFLSDTQYVDAFTAAFVSHIKDRVLQSLSWHFLYWTVGADPTQHPANPYNFPASADVTVTAHFAVST